MILISNHVPTDTKRSLHHLHFLRWQFWVTVIQNRAATLDYCRDVTVCLDLQNIFIVRCSRVSEPSTAFPNTQNDEHKTLLGNINITSVRILTPLFLILSWRIDEQRTVDVISHVGNRHTGGERDKYSLSNWFLNCLFCIALWDVCKARWPPAPCACYSILTPLTLMTLFGVHSKPRSDF